MIVTLESSPMPSQRMNSWQQCDFRDRVECVDDGRTDTVHQGRGACNQAHDQANDAAQGKASRMRYRLAVRLRLISPPAISLPNAAK